RYQCSFPSSEEERQATQVLSHLAQHSDLTIEQQVQVAEALYRCSLSSSEEERQAFQMLSRLAQNDSLTTNQRRQAIRVLLAAGTANYSDKIRNYSDGLYSCR